MKRANRILAVLRALVTDLRGVGVPGLTRGEIRRAANLPEDTEVTRPCRDLRKEPYGLDIHCDEYNENEQRVWRYWLPVVELYRARQILESSATPADPKREDDDPADPSSTARYGGDVARPRSAYLKGT